MSGLLWSVPLLALSVLIVWCAGASVLRMERFAWKWKDGDYDDLSADEIEAELDVAKSWRRPWRMR